MPGARRKWRGGFGWLVVLAGIAVAALVLHLAFGRGGDHPMPPPDGHGDNPSGALYVRDLGRLPDGRHTFDLVYELVLRNASRERRIVGIRDQLAIGDPGGTGDVIDPDEGIATIGSGGSYALASARALLENTELSAREIAEKSLRIAGQICIYTNDNIMIEELKAE